MPHQRHRILSQQLERSIGLVPVTAVIGARQTGKTTLLKHYAKSYFTFDDPKLEGKIAKGGELLLSSIEKPGFFDEVQKYEPIFDLLKLVVDQERRPGRFLITGSVRFSQKSSIRESLTGRVQTWTLLPLTVSESYEKPFHSWLDKLGGKKSLGALAESMSKRSWISTKSATHYLKNGGLPGMCFVRDDAQRVSLQGAYLDTLLGRDLLLLRKSSLRFEQHLKILTEIARTFPQPIEFSHLARIAKVSSPTLKATLDAYEGLFLIQRHGSTYYFNDSGMLSYLHDCLADPDQWLAQWLFQELRAQVEYRRELQFSLEEYRTRGGAHVPFVLRSRKRGVTSVAICHDSGEAMSEKTLKSLYSYAKRDPSCLLIAFNLGTKAYLHKNRILALPWTVIA